MLRPDSDHTLLCRLTAEGKEIMREFARHAQHMRISPVSPYLQQPLRTREQALADIAAARSKQNNVTSLADRRSAKRKASSNMVAA